jgi:peptidoglycan hydrolase CwlO-like protein
MHGDNDDMQGKMNNQRDNIAKREQEIAELRERISQRANQSNDLRRQLDRLVLD